MDQRRAFGFNADGSLCDSEVAVIRELATRLLAGESQYQLEAELHQRGIFSVNDKPWSRNTIRYTMTRPRNAGYVVHNGEIVEGIRLPEVILDADTHNRLIALFAARRPGRPASGRYLLTGFADCGRCTHSLSGRPRSHLHYSDGEVRKQYWCSDGTGGCGRLTIDCRILEAHILDWTIRTLADPKHSDAIARAESELAAKRKPLLKELADIEVTLLEIAGRLGRQEITLARHDAVCRPLEARQAELATALAGLSEAATAEPPQGLLYPQLPERSQAFLALLVEAEESTIAGKRAMVARALNGRRIIVGPGKAARFDADRVTIA
jgi:hypothetical protein